MTDTCSVPYVYTVEITSACNAKCAGCGNVFARDNTYITPEQARVVVERISRSAEMIRITGGEPTVSPAFVELAHSLDSLGKPIVIFTNGVWNKPGHVIETLQSIRNLDGILVSLHGHCAAAYEAFTRGDNFDVALENIRRASQAGIAVNTNTILTRHTIDHMTQVVERAMEAGAKVIAFSRYYGVPIPGLTELAPEQLKFAVTQVARMRAVGLPVKFNNNIPLCLGGELTQACPAGDTHCTISPTCKVRVCNHSTHEVGDILATSIEQIWQSERVNGWRRQIPSMCLACGAFELCRAGCRANAAANGLAADPLACGPLRDMPEWSTPIRLSLKGDFLPQAHFASRREDFGFVLINRSQILKVSHEADPLIQALMGGETTLSGIRDRFGQAALNFVGLLYDRRMVELACSK
jgi:radical SAM protein with 4Fe4S-binding SPASM domain